LLTRSSRRRAGRSRPGRRPVRRRTPRRRSAPAEIDDREDEQDDAGDQQLRAVQEPQPIEPKIASPRNSSSPTTMSMPGQEEQHQGDAAEGSGALDLVRDLRELGLGQVDVGSIRPTSALACGRIARPDRAPRPGFRLRRVGPAVPESEEDRSRRTGQPRDLLRVVVKQHGIIAAAKAKTAGRSRCAARPAVPGD
jgi:hypothetical protein